MALSRRPLALILLLAMTLPACAGSAEALGGSGIYTFVDAYGVTVFTDIPPMDAAPPEAAVPALRSGLPALRPHPGAGHRAADAAPQVVAAALQAPSDPLQDVVAPELRDGGPPPEDR